MIERLLAADAALERDDLDTAEKLFVQVADADPRNAIAAVGLGRVAAGRDDAEAARAWFRRALEIDPEEAAARRLLDALDREVPLSDQVVPAGPGPVPVTGTATAPVGPRPAGVTPAEHTTPAAPAPVAEAARPSILNRLLRMLGIRRSGGKR